MHLLKPFYRRTLYRTSFKSITPVIGSSSVNSFEMNRALLNRTKNSSYCHNTLLKNIKRVGLKQLSICSFHKSDCKQSARTSMHQGQKFDFHKINSLLIVRASQVHVPPDGKHYQHHQEKQPILHRSNEFLNRYRQCVPVTSSNTVS